MMKEYIVVSPAEISAAYAHPLPFGTHYCLEKLSVPNIMRCCARKHGHDGPHEAVGKNWQTSEAIWYTEL